MVYEYCSSEEVIADLISKTRMIDATYADDILEWLRQGINIMRVKQMYTRHNKILEVNDNISKLPCGIRSIDGIFYNGKRLRQGTGSIDTRCSPFTVLKKDFQSYFTTDTTSDGFTDNEQSYLLLRGDDLKLNNMSVCTENYYIPQPNHLQFSFKCGCVQLFWSKMPVDDRGYPLIPDEENTKYALVWWLMAQLCIGGYKHPDPKMDYDYCEAKFDQFADIGKRKIKRASVDQKEAMVQLTVNLIPPTGYYDSFFINGEQKKFAQI